jgi:hypothetical protein
MNIISCERRRDSSEDSIDQSYEDGIKNQFVPELELLSMEYTILILSITHKIHLAGTLVLFSQGEAMLLHDVIQPTAIVSYCPLSSNFH